MPRAPALLPCHSRIPARPGSAPLGNRWLWRYDALGICTPSFIALRSQWRGSCHSPLHAARCCSWMAAGTAPTRCCWPGRWLPKKAKGKGQTQAKVNISAALVEDIINLEETSADMQAVVEALKEDFNRNLNVRTSQGALDHIIVTTKDGKFPLNQLGQISQKSPQLVVVNMTNFPESTAAAMKAIRESGMNLNPEVDGTLIRVPVPKRGGRGGGHHYLHNC
ncbi:ribosome-recycling factor, mitochondrial isoform X4 [Numida meleagris]|uniref:ribosome-recycling factor, mitochondrial isoform X4 n=1 Tax=Numida meleagris TaxID=8996 RepID=UPI000B3D8865|nr:ribosome-recycling factor, mitochondrial isoform X4 [Numida meleagris]